MKNKQVSIDLDEHFAPQLVEEARRAFQGDYKKKLVTIVEGILLAKRGGYLETHDPEFDLELHAHRSSLRVIIKGIPESKLVQGRLIRQKELQILAGIRDLLFSRTLARPTDRKEGIPEYIFQFVRNANVLTRADVERNPFGRIMVQGGHHIPHHESVHHKRLGFGLGLLGFEMVTGSGPGSMEDPFKGAMRGYMMNHHRDRKYIGITEDGIISGEPCNDYIDNLIVFPDIEKRLEAFVRMSRSGLIVPGGVGTLEEILTILWIKTHSRNKDWRFPLYFCQPTQSGSYFKGILELLELWFGTDFEKAGHARLFVSDAVDKSNDLLDPRRAAYALGEEMRENAQAVRRRAHENDEPWFPLWDWDLYFPEALQKPLVIDHAFVESLDFRSDLPIEDLFFSLRSLASAIVEVNVRDRGYLDRHGAFKLKGDPAMLQAVDRLFESFSKEGRMGSREYRCPYVIR